MRNPNEDPVDPDSSGLKKKAHYRAPALEKGLDILELLVDRQFGMAQADICRALKRSRSELYRMMQVLEERGYIYRVDRYDRYALTMKLYFLGQHHAPTRSLGALVTPLLQQFALQTVQSCYLTVFDGDTMVVIATAGAETEWNLAVRVGTRVPLHGSAVGEMYLAFQDEDVRTRLLRNIGPAMRCFPDRTRRPPVHAARRFADLLRHSRRNVGARRIRSRYEKSVKWPVRFLRRRIGGRHFVRKRR